MAALTAPKWLLERFIETIAHADWPRDLQLCQEVQGTLVLSAHGNGAWQYFERLMVSGLHFESMQPDAERMKVNTDGTLLTAFQPTQKGRRRAF